MIITEDGARLPTVTDTGIYGFFGEYRFLSNFHVLNTPISLDGISYLSSEAAYMAGKTDDRAQKLELARLSPSAAKRFGQRVKLRPDWEQVKTVHMLEVLTLKFTDPVLAVWLLTTGERYLEETNNWGDKFWGVCDGEGKNWLGRLLMIVRRQLQGETSFLLDRLVEAFNDAPDAVETSGRVIIRP